LSEVTSRRRSLRSTFTSLTAHAGASSGSRFFVDFPGSSAQGVGQALVSVTSSPVRCTSSEPSPSTITAGPSAFSAAARASIVAGTSLSATSVSTSTGSVAPPPVVPAAKPTGAMLIRFRNTAVPSLGALSQTAPEPLGKPGPGSQPRLASGVPRSVAFAHVESS